jgi:predicted methyltransferase
MTNAKGIADKAKKELIEMTDDGNSIIGKIKLTKAYGQKTDYKKACEDAGIDLDNYKSEYIRWTPRRIK